MSSVLIAEWRLVSSEKSFSNSADPKPKHGKIAEAVSTKMIAQAGNILCGFCGQETIQHGSVVSIVTRPAVDFLRNKKKALQTAIFKDCEEKSLKTIN